MLVVDKIILTEAGIQTKRVRKRILISRKASFLCF